LYYKAGEIQKGDALYAIMIDDYLTEYKYLADFDKGSGLKQNFNICGQVLGSLTRITQVHRRNDNTFTYFEEDNKFYRSKENLEKEEIEYNSYRINTFLDEYYALQ
jgi:hypothetical protein